jgi:stress response protein YsnF
VESIPPIRREGNVTIVPVVEEVLKVERYLVLKEEVHIRRVKQTERFQETVTLRRQQAQISRNPLKPTASKDGAVQTSSQPERKPTMSAYEKIVTLFDTAEHAQVASTNLQHAGFDANEISIVSGDELPKSATALREPGLWHRLFGSDIEQHEATVYAKAVESGGVVLSLRAPQEDVARAMGILNQHNLVDVKDRAVDTGVISKETAAAIAAPAAAATAAALPAKPVTSDLGRDQVIRLAEEHLEVGKRLVEQGTTRIRRFVTEKAVEEQVTLHEEHAEVVRRAITDPNYITDIDWADTMVEVRETAEEAVVSKSARVVEEVAVGKTGSDHVETVHDTVRRQQVEVEHLDADRNRKA